VGIDRLHALAVAYATKTQYMEYTDWDVVRRVWVLERMTLQDICGLEDGTGTFKLGHTIGKMHTLLDMTDCTALLGGPTGYAVIAVALWHLLHYAFYPTIRLAICREIFYVPPDEPVLWLCVSNTVAMVGMRAPGGTLFLGTPDDIVSVVLSALQVENADLYKYATDTEYEAMPGGIIDCILRAAAE
jgi:hypothetical protein